MKRPLAYITAAWSGERTNDTQQAARYCRAVYEAGFSPICPLLYLPLILNNAVPEEHKSGVDMSRDLLRRSHVLVVCGAGVNEDVKNDIATAGKLCNCFCEICEKRKIGNRIRNISLRSSKQLK